MKKSKFSFKQKGFTLIEIGIVVALGGLLLFGLSQAPRIIADHKANAEIAELPWLVAAIQKIFENRATFVGVTLAQVIAFDGFDPLRTNAGVATNRWGGLITLAVGTNFTAGDSMDIISAGVPALECAKIIPVVEGLFTDITINGVVVKRNGSEINKQNMAIGCDVLPASNITYRFAKVNAKQGITNDNK